MPRIKLEFENAAGRKLAGLLDTPPQNTPIACYALFAHCFSCGKDSKAATRISRALASRGIAVLRFDFTGVGQSEGELAATDFSSNVSDLLAAADKLSRDYRPPRLLVGHSRGGAVVLDAAAQLPEVQAVATIGAPARAGVIAPGKALLVFHSPTDQIVPIDDAAKIYQSASHPKSFISLDDADHLLLDPEDAEYVALTLAAWASRYLGLRAQPAEDRYGSAPPVGEHEVVVTELDRRFLRGLFTTHHRWMADEPAAYGGTDLGPSPYGLLLMALGACTSMTLRMFANHERLPLEDVRVRLRHKHVHIEDAEDFDAEDRRLEVIEVGIELEGDLGEAERLRLLEVAGRCPVHKTLMGELSIRKRLVPEP
jgi:uncharacterized OsmC-like protein/alpha/beta superfamily hydrolase